MPPPKPPTNRAEAAGADGDRGFGATLRCFWVVIDSFAVAWLLIAAERGLEPNRYDYRIRSQALARKIVMKPDEILIIGAGAAGLAAAHRLVAAGVKATVLEARDRVGGRIHTVHAAWPMPVEAGPEFIHGNAAEMRRLLTLASTKTEEIPGEHWQFVGGKPHRIDFDRAWGEVLKRLEEYSGPDLSFAAFFEQYCGNMPPEDRTLAIEYVEGFNAADHRLVSLDWLRKTELEMGAASGAAISRLSTPYDRITQALLSEATGARICLNSRVSTIRWQPKQVEAEVTEKENRSETYVGLCAIITLPLGVLQASSQGEAGVEFIPDLAQKADALDQLKMGAVVKAKLWFREPFWIGLGATERGFLHIPGRRFMTWWPLGDSPVLTGWSGGPRAHELSAQTDEAMLAIAVAELAQGLTLDERRLRELLIDARVFNWQKDRLALGAYSYAVAGRAAATRRLAEPIANTIFFAGEATDEIFPATVAGAVRSGYRAADEVLRSLK